MTPEESATGDNARDGVGGLAGGAASTSASAQRPIFPTLNDLRDLPERLLPEETVQHLRNAGREALLAVYSLWRSIDNARLGKQTNKVRKHIEIE